MKLYCKVPPSLVRRLWEGKSPCQRMSCQSLDGGEMRKISASWEEFDERPWEDDKCEKG